MERAGGEDKAANKQQMEGIGVRRNHQLENVKMAIRSYCAHLEMYKEGMMEEEKAIIRDALMRVERGLRYIPAAAAAATDYLLGLQSSILVDIDLCYDKMEILCRHAAPETETDLQFRRQFQLLLHRLQLQLEHYQKGLKSKLKLEEQPTTGTSNFNPSHPPIIAADKPQSSSSSCSQREGDIKMETAGDQDEANNKLLMKGNNRLDDDNKDDKVVEEITGKEKEKEKEKEKKNKKKGKKKATGSRMSPSQLFTERLAECYSRTVRSYYTQLERLPKDKDVSTTEERIILLEALTRVQDTVSDMGVSAFMNPPEWQRLEHKLFQDLKLCADKLNFILRIHNNLEPDMSILSKIMRNKARLEEKPSTCNFDPDHQPIAAEPNDERVEPQEDQDAKEQRRLRALELEQEDHELIARYRRTWELCYAPEYGSFDDTTVLRAMRYAGCPPKDATHGYGVQIISVKIAAIHDEGLHWPLHVYGFMAARDSIDPRRNFLYNRTRDDCQILTEEDPYLVLTGPSRAIVYLERVFYEVQLKAKGKTKSEDKNLHFDAFHTGYHTIVSSAAPPSMSTLPNTCRSSTIHLTFAVVGQSVEATTTIRLVDGSWPDDIRGLVVSRTESLDDGEIVLLDSQDGRMPFDHHGFLNLSRRVISVELYGKLKIDVLAVQVDDKECSDVVKKQVVLTPKKYSLSTVGCDLGFCKLSITVVWSLIMLR